MGILYFVIVHEIGQAAYWVPVEVLFGSALFELVS